MATKNATLPNSAVNGSDKTDGNATAILEKKAGINGSGVVEIKGLTSEDDKKTEAVPKIAPQQPAPKADEMIDPACDPRHPQNIQFSDISSAAFNIRDGIIQTPCNRSPQLSSLLGMDLYLKKEFMQVTGSFKERGARFALLKLTEKQRKAGAIAASAGNHALALAYHGQQLGIPITVIMPVFAPLMKVSSCRNYGAHVIQMGQNIQQCKEYGFKYSREHGMTYINGFDHPDVVAGQGTIGLEILDQVSKVDAVIVPVGGGGLVAGVAKAVKTLRPDVLVIGVEAETCPSFINAMEKKNLPLDPESSLAD
uniref:Tryptophan synthase beta chain-like PALP domain-containing protein n=1 Tax=Panagrolaimus sp. JU765 TaxID=591449 RepID=A0AC34RBN4_9BILA